MKNIIKCIIWSIVFFAFIIWVGNLWWLLLYPFVFDLFITEYIPYDFWKKYKDTNIVLYTICSWVDAIGFALIAVYFINLFLFQNYQIPTSSLEKSLLVGDFLFVSKASYGPRIPNTPLSFPLVQHTLPIFNSKSYIETPQWEYRRLKGWDTVKEGDIVVFNFPAGDTVAINQPNPDYYTLCKLYGREIVNSRPDYFGEIVYRPVDRRENYVKRCVGLPGDTLSILDNQVYINGKEQVNPEFMQLNYYIQTKGVALSDDFLTELGVSKEDRHILSPSTDMAEYTYVGLNETKPTYHVPLTEAMKERLLKTNMIDTIIVEPEWRGGMVFPVTAEYGWTRDNYGPIYIPKKGATIELTVDNLPIYEQCIVNYERNKLVVNDSSIFINGELTTSYTFKMDYYWMHGDNRHKSADSRYWGFVPEDHIVGRPIKIWLSLDSDKSWFRGKIRWNRFLKDASR